MPDALPIACSLTSDDRSVRVAEIAAVGRASLVSVRGATLVFADAADTRERLEAIVAAETRCCPFLTLTLTDHRDGVELTIAGPPDAAPVVRDLVGAFAGTTLAE